MSLSIPNSKRSRKMRGFTEIATAFKEIGDVEENHEKRYRKLLANVKSGTVSREIRASNGNAETAVTFTKGQKRPRYAPHASTRRHITN